MMPGVLGWGVIALGLLVILLPFWVESRRPKVDRDARKDVPGSFVKLSQGVTRYRWQGAARGPVLVAIHGLTTPSQTFDRLAPLLGALGFRVLTYDLYGRGLSDAPKGRQDRAFFLQQLRDLLTALEIEDGFTLLGYSMGGVIATALAEEEPHRVHRLVLLAPAGMDINLSRFEKVCVSFPIIGDWLLLAASLRRSVASSLGPLRRGFLPAVLSSLRHMLRERQGEAHRALGRSDVPVIAIWGRADTRIPITGLGQLAQWNRNARQHVIDGADHRLPTNAPDAVAKALADILSDRD